MLFNPLRVQSNTNGHFIMIGGFEIWSSLYDSHPFRTFEKVNILLRILYLALVLFNCAQRSSIRIVAGFYALTFRFITDLYFIIYL